MVQNDTPRADGATARTQVSAKPRLYGQSPAGHDSFWCSRCSAEGLWPVPFYHRCSAPNQTGAVLQVFVLLMLWPTRHTACSSHITDSFQIKQI